MANEIDKAIEDFRLTCVKSGATNIITVITDWLKKQDEINKEDLIDKLIELNKTIGKIN